MVIEVLSQNMTKMEKIWACLFILGVDNSIKHYKEAMGWV